MLDLLIVPALVPHTDLGPLNMSSAEQDSECLKEMMGESSSNCNGLIPLRDFKENPPGVSPLQGLHFFSAYPALPGWANSCRASGAGVSSCRRHHRAQSMDYS